MKNQPKDYEPPKMDNHDPYIIKDRMDYHDFAPWDEEPVKVWSCVLCVLGRIVAIGFLCVLGFLFYEVY